MSISLEKFDYIFNQIDFEKYAIKHSCASDFDNMSLSEENDSGSVVNYGMTRIARITEQYFAYGVKNALATLDSFIQTLTTQKSTVPNQGIGALFYVAQSCGVVLNLLDDKQVNGFKLKESMEVINDPEETGHLNGIRGLIYLLFNDLEAAAPFFRRAIPATNRFYEYVYGLAKTIARKRRFESSSEVIFEEIELFTEVAANHPFAVPQLLHSLKAGIRDMKRKHAPDVHEIEIHFDTVLEDAWNKKELFGSIGLTRLAMECKAKRQNSRAKELYKMAYDKNPNNGLNLHQYGLFLLTTETNIEDVKRGFGYLTRAGHLSAFTTFLEFYFSKNSIFQRSDYFSDYLEQFISFAQNVSYKCLYLYIAYRYFLVQGDFQKGISYLKTAINVDLDNLTFEFMAVFKRSTLPALKNLLRTDFLPKTVDLSYEVGYIIDPNQKINVENTDVPCEEIVTNFKAWWETTGLKPMTEYAGYREYLKKRHSRSNTRSATVNRSHARASNQWYSSTIHGRLQDTDQGSSSSNWRVSTEE